MVKIGDLKEFSLVFHTHFPVLAVQNSSISDLVTHWLSHWVTHSLSHFWFLTFLIREMERHEKNTFWQIQFDKYILQIHFEKYIWTNIFGQIHLDKFISPNTFLAVHRQLNRWPCHWLSDWVTDWATFDFWHQRAILETCDLWNICSEWWEDMIWP